MNQSTPPCAADSSPTSSRLAKIARGGVLMLGGSTFEAVFIYAAWIVIARLLGKADFGIFALGISAIGLNVVLYELGIPTAVMRYIAVYDGEGDAARAKGTAIGGTALCGLLGLVGAVTLALLAKPISQHIFGKPKLATILPIMAIQLPALSAMAALLRTTQARGTMRYRVLVEKIALPVTRLVLVASIVLLGYGLTGAAWGVTIAALMSLALSVLFAWRMGQQAWGPVKPRWELWRLVAYAFPLMLGALALYARNRGITLTLGVLGSSGQVGVFSAAERTAIAAAMGLKAVGAIFAPISADLYNRKAYQELQRILKTAAAWVVMAVLPVEVFLILCGREVMGTFGKGFFEGYVCLVILASAHVLNCLFGSVNVLLTMCAKQWLVLADLVFFGLVSIGLATLLIPPMGVIGAAIAGAVGILGPRITRVIEVAILMRMTPFGTGQLRAIACVVVPATLILVWRQLFPQTLSHWLFLPLAVPTYLLVYLAALRLGAREELDQLLAVIRKRGELAKEPDGAATVRKDIASHADPSGGNAGDLGQ